MLKQNRPTLFKKGYSEHITWLSMGSDNSLSVYAESVSEHSRALPYSIFAQTPPELS